MALSFVTQRQRTNYYLSVWLVIILLHALLFVLVLKVKWQWAALDSLVFNLIYSFLGLSFWYPCQFISLEKASLAKILVNHVLAAALVTLIWIGSAHAILVNVFHPGEPYLQILNKSLPWRFLMGVLFYFVTVSFYYLLIYYENFQEKLLRESELKALVKEAELKTLKFQLNPHFIFNSLNSIHSLTLTDPESAGRMTVKLGNFLRYTLSKNEKQFSPLAEELESAKLYLEIEKVRFADKFEFKEEVEKGCDGILVPSMILQPLFENAIKHGVYESLDKVAIKLTCEKLEDYLRISLENDFDPEAVSKSGEGIGLQNIEKRLEMLYNQIHLLKVEKQDRRFRVSLLIPLKR
ncbi:MAG: sensor histidine kinase [bacterium]